MRRDRLFHVIVGLAASAFTSTACGGRATSSSAPPGATGEVVLECASGKCTSRYKGDTFACGAKTCTSAQYCLQETGGPAGSPTTYGCVDDSNCAEGCAGCSLVGCACNGVQGHNVVTCAYP